MASNRSATELVQKDLVIPEVGNLIQNYAIRKPTSWVGIELKGRSCDGTYKWYDYHTLPPVAIYPEFAHVKTWQDLEKNLELLEQTNLSVTGCYYNLSRPPIFYMDSQGCVIWALNVDHQVYCHPNLSEVVSHSLPEFLSRVRIESILWRKSVSQKLDPANLSPEELDYLSHYVPELTNPQ